MLSSSLLSTSSSMACCSPFIVVGAGAGTVAVAVAVAVVLLALFIARLLIVPSLLSSSSSFAPSFLRSFAVVPSVTSADCNGNSQRPTNGRQTTNERRRSVRTAFLHSTSKNQRPKTHKPQHSVQFSIFIQFPFFTLHSFTLRNPNFKNNRNFAISQFRNFEFQHFILHSLHTTKIKRKKETSKMAND